MQVGPRFVERTHSYDSFDGISYTHESFSCKLVVTYRVITITTVVAGAREHGNDAMAALMSK